LGLSDQKDDDDDGDGGGVSWNRTECLVGGEDDNDDVAGFKIEVEASDVIFCGQLMILFENYYLIILCIHPIYIFYRHKSL
jgi:hypothetical protein